MRCSGEKRGSKIEFQHGWFSQEQSSLLPQKQNASTKGFILMNLQVALDPQLFSTKSDPRRLFPLAHFTPVIAPVFENRKYSFSLSGYTPYLQGEYVSLAISSKKSFSELLSLHFLLFIFFLITASLDCTYTYLGVLDNTCPQVLPKIEFTFLFFLLLLDDFQEKEKNADLHNHIYSRCTQCLNYQGFKMSYFLLGKI